MKLFKLNIVTRVPSDNILERTKLKSLSMKKLLYFTIVVLLTFSCTTQSSHGHLIGAMGRPAWYQTDPYGMLYIPAGAFNMGQSDQDVPLTHYNETKTVS